VLPLLICCLFAGCLCRWQLAPALGGQVHQVLAMSEAEAAVFAAVCLPACLPAGKQAANEAHTYVHSTKHSDLLQIRPAAAGLESLFRSE